MYLAGLSDNLAKCSYYLGPGVPSLIEKRQEFVSY